MSVTGVSSLTTDQLEKEAADKSFSYERYNSTSSRLSSVSTPGSLDERHDSLSSIASSAASLAPTGSVFILSPHTTYSTTTITSSPSLLSPSLLPTSPCPHIPNGGAPYHSTPRPLSPAPHSPTLSRNTSLSSSLLYHEPDPHDEGCVEGNSRATSGTNSGHVHLPKRYSHMRSHSNPNAHLIAVEVDHRRGSPGPLAADQPEVSICRSPSPPHRTSSQSSVTIQGSPGAVQRRTHHTKRRSQLHSGPLTPESPVQRSSAYSSSHYDYPIRSNSLTYAERRASSECTGVCVCVCVHHMTSSDIIWYWCRYELPGSRAPALRGGGRASYTRRHLFQYGGSPHEVCHQHGVPGGH